MDVKYKTKNAKGIDINVSVLGFFRVPELDKEYVMYAIEDEDPSNDMGAVILGEVVRDLENEEIITIMDIPADEIDLVVAFYNEIESQV